MEKKEIVEALIPRLRMLELGQISCENMAKLLAIYILDLFEVWKNEQGRNP